MEISMVSLHKTEKSMVSLHKTEKSMVFCILKSEKRTVIQEY
jgi:hypothetical protein